MRTDAPGLWATRLERLRAVPANLDIEMAMPVRSADELIAHLQQARRLVETSYLRWESLSTLCCDPTGRGRYVRAAGRNRSARPDQLAGWRFTATAAVQHITLGKPKLEAVAFRVLTLSVGVFFPRWERNEGPDYVPVGRDLEEVLDAMLRAERRFPAWLEGTWQ